MASPRRPQALAANTTNNQLQWTTPLWPSEIDALQPTADFTASRIPLLAMGLIILRGGGGGGPGGLGAGVHTDGALSHRNSLRSGLRLFYDYLKLKNYKRKSHSGYPNISETKGT